MSRIAALATIILCLALLAPLVHAEGETTPAKTDSPLEISATEHGWTVHAMSIDAHELLTTFAAKAHLQLIVDDALKRRITIHIVDKPALDVLKIIVDAFGFAWAEVDSLNIISEGMPRSPSSYLLSDIASVTTKYVTPSQAWALLPTFLQGEVKINSDQNAVILSGPKPLLDKFRQNIGRFDIPAEQIMLNVDVVEFTDMNTDTFAALLNYSNDHIGISTDSLTGQQTLTALATLPTDFLARIKALVEQRRARVRANPRIATVSGRWANIFIGQQQYLTNPVNIPGRGSSYSIDAGVSLDITPLTGGDGEIILDLNEEISTLSAPDAITGLPTKTTRSAYSTIRVRDGQTIVIGGLRQAEERSTRKAIPVLSELPLVGSLFRAKKLDSTMVELAIFITANTLSRDGHLPAEEELQIKKRAGLEGK
jgi:type II secretory pathway component GspD/PulD (secretin)